VTRRVFLLATLALVGVVAFAAGSVASAKPALAGSAAGATRASCYADAVDASSSPLVEPASPSRDATSGNHRCLAWHQLASLSRSSRAESLPTRNPANAASAICAFNNVTPWPSSK
jgi:hypothetical protein